MTRISSDEEDLAMNEPPQGVTGGGGTPERSPYSRRSQSDLATELASATGIERFSVVVIGGGHTGLAAGYELAQRGIDFVILEKDGRLGENWRPRWDSLRLFTPARFDGLPGFPFQAEEGRPLTRDHISEYLEQYAQRFGLPVRLGIDVLGLRTDERGQVLVDWEHGRLVADQVIVATDLQGAQWRTTHDRDRQTLQLRTGEYRTISQLSLAGGVVMLGSGPIRLAAGSSYPEVVSRAAARPDAIAHRGQG